MFLCLSSYNRKVYICWMLRLFMINLTKIIALSAALACGGVIHKGISATDDLDELVRVKPTGNTLVLPGCDTLSRQLGVPFTKDGFCEEVTRYNPDGDDNSYNNIKNAITTRGYVMVPKKYIPKGYDSQI